MSNNNYMNYLDYLISIDNQKLITNELQIKDKNIKNVIVDTSVIDEDNNIITSKKYVDEQIRQNLVGKIDTNNGEIFNDYNNNKATGNYSHASGFNNKAYGDYLTVIGKYNNYENDDINNNKLFVVGNGNDNNNRKNAFIVYNTGECWSNVFTTENADYAELFEIYDKNNNINDFKYKFISLIDDKVKIASSNDDFILGVYSSNPGILANKNNNYNKNHFIPVGLLGKLIVIDNGTCKINSFCKCDNNGCAVPYDKNIDKHIKHWKVIKRFDDNKIFIIFK